MEKDNLIVLIVALVAIVGIVALVLAVGRTGSLPSVSATGAGGTQIPGTSCWCFSNGGMQCVYGTTYVNYMAGQTPYDCNKVIAQSSRAAAT